MKDYLTEKRNEVFTMLDFQWDLDEAKIAWQNKGRAEGIESVAFNLLNIGMLSIKFMKPQNFRLIKSKNSQRIASARNIRLPEVLLTLSS